MNGETIKAKHILIATGGRPVLPTIPGGEHAITSDGFFELEDLPKYTFFTLLIFNVIDKGGIKFRCFSKPPDKSEYLKITNVFFLLL